MTEGQEGRSYDDDLIPDVEDNGWPDMVGYIKSRVSMRDAYTKFVPKQGGIGRPVSGGKETFIRCPSPSHVDKKPSAWMQEAEGLWYCAGCGIGGDQFDLAAHATGLPVPGYKSDATSFTDLVNEVAERFAITEDDARGAGYIAESRPPGAADVSPEWPEDFTPSEMAEALVLYESWDSMGVSGAKDNAVRDVVARRGLAQRSAELSAHPEPEVEPGLSRRIDIEAAKLIRVNTSEVATSYDEAIQKGLMIDIGQDPEFAHVPWQDVIPPDTPIGRMLKACCVTDIPDEYFVWCIYTALGSMIGRRVELFTSRGAVDPALWTVILGATGSYKSTVAVEMDRVLSKVCPPDGADGVKLIGVPASGERFLEQIRRDDLPAVVGALPGVGLVELPNAASFMYSDEFSLLGNLLSRPGSTLASILLQTYATKRDYVLRPTESMSRITYPVTGPMVSILSTTQPSRISDMLSKYDVASGFMNRFIFGAGQPRRVCVPMMGFGPDYSVVEREFRVIQDSFESHSSPATIDSPWQLTPDSSGLIAWREWMHNQAERVKNLDEFTADLLARSELVLLKITLLMAVNRIAAGDPYLNWHEGDVAAAIAHYPNLEVGWLGTGSRVLETDDTKLEDWIVKKVDSFGEKGVSRRQLQQLIPKSMRRNAKALNDAIVGLERGDAIRQVELRQGKSKKSIMWVYSGKLDPTTVLSKSLDDAGEEA